MENSDPTASLSWYCFRSQPKRERIAIESIRREAGLEALCPRIRFFKKTRTARKRFVEALFPSYLFVECDLNVHLRHILSLRGVSGIVKYGPRIPELPLELINALREEFDSPDEIVELPESEIEVGSKVEIAEGPFQSLKAVVREYVPAEQRVEVLVEILGREIPVTVGRKSVFRDED